MTKAYIVLPADSTGKAAETIRLILSGATNVHREVLALGGTTIGAITDVLNADPSASAYGLVVRQVPTSVRQIVLSPTAASFNVTAAIALPSYQKVLNASYASFLAQTSVPGYVRVQNATAASFLVSASLSGGALYVQLPDRLGQLTRASSLSVTLSTNAVVQAITPGVQRVTNLTMASFLASVSFPAPQPVFKDGYQKVLNASFASFLVTSTLPGYARVTSNSSASFAAAIPGVVRVANATAASFLVTAKSISLTSASFLAQVNIPGILREVTTRGSAVMAVDHSAMISVSAASFTTGNKGISYAGVWPAAQSTGVYNPITLDTLGRVVTIPNAPPGRTFSTTFSLFSVNAQAIVNAVGGNRLYITDLRIVNVSATACSVTFVNGQTGAGLKTGRVLGVSYVAGMTAASSVNAWANERDYDYVTPVFTNVNATFAGFLSRTVQSVKVSVSGYQSTV